MLQAGNAIDEGHLKDLFLQIAETFGGTSPDIDFSSFIDKVREFEETSKQIEAVERTTPLASTHGLLPNEVTILVTIADKSGTNSGIPSYELKGYGEEVGLRPVASILAYKGLKRKLLVEDYPDSDYNGNQYESIRLTDAGWEWLQQNQEVIDLSHKTPSPTPPTPSRGGQDRGDDIPF